MVFWTQALGVAGWALGIWVSGTAIHVPPHMWGWIALAALCAGGYSYLLTRASSRGEISVVGPVLALAPIFSILPDWWLTEALPRGVGWIGVGLSVVDTAGLSRTPTRRLDLRTFFSRGDALDALGSAVLLGVLAAVAFQVLALALAPAAYVSSIRRGSAVFTVLLGSALFKEEGMVGRLAAALLTVLGAVCLVLGR